MIFRTAWSSAQKFVLPIAAGTLIIGVIFGLILVLLPKQTPTPLIGDDWHIDGEFFRYPLEISPHEIPRDILASRDFMAWRSWSPETRGTIGTIRTGSFPPPSYMAVPFYGFPAERPGSRIFLHCLSTGAEMDVARQRTNTQWAVAYLHVPKAFCRDAVALVATVADRSFYIGVGTPFSISFISYCVHTSVFPRIVVATATWLMFCLLTLAGACAATIAGHRKDGLAVGCVLAGVLGILIFLIFHFSPKAGVVTAWTTNLATGLMLISVWVWNRPSLIWLVGRGVKPALIWLAVSVSYISFVCSIDNGGGSWAVNDLFTPVRWSSDNQLPWWFAEALYSNVPRDQIIWGSWLASDRPPLLAGLLLITRSTIAPAFERGIGSDFIPLVYELAAITLLTSWSGALYYICRLFGRRRAAYVVWLAFVTPFFLFNSVYIWPKLLGGTFVLIAFALLLKLRAERGDRWTLPLVAVCAALAYLAHGSNAFALAPLAFAFFGTIWRRGPREIAVAVVLALLCLAPWLWWQSTVQPGGTALVRFALSGDYGFSDRNQSLISSVAAAYQRLGFSGWLELKVDALRYIVGSFDLNKAPGEITFYSPGMNVFGKARIFDFVSALRSVGVGTVGAVFVIIWMLRKWLLARPSGARGNIALSQFVAEQATIIGIAGVIIAAIVMIPSPIMHTHAYGSLLLVFLGGSLTLSAWPWQVRAVLATLATAYFGLVWIYLPIAIALRLDPIALIVAALAAISVWVLITPGSIPAGLVRRKLSGRDGSPYRPKSA